MYFVILSKDEVYFVDSKPFFTEPSVATENNEEINDLVDFHEVFDEQLFEQRCQEFEEKEVKRQSEKILSNTVEKVEELTQNSSLAHEKVHAASKKVEEASESLKENTPKGQPSMSEVFPSKPSKKTKQPKISNFFKKK